MVRKSLAAGLAGVLALSLAACGQDKTPTAEESGVTGDVANDELTGNLADQIKIDPKLAGSSAPGEAKPVELPAEQRSPAAIAAAKAEAVRLAGGKLEALPSPAVDAPSGKTVTDAGARLAGPGGQCASKAEHRADWATRMPAPFAAYPQAKVVEAAGSDAGGCSLRVLNFVTAVAPADVLSYYYTRARAAGLGAVHRTDGGDAVLGGSSAMRAYLVYARTLSNGLTEVDVLTSG